MLIFLTGFMGAGKTTAGKKVAALLNYTFIDLDALIEKETGKTISELFSISESHFRDIESKILVKTAEANNAVIATGGGTPCFKDNMKWMNEHGVTVYIKLAAGSLFHRLAASKKDRPLLQKKGDVALMEYIMETLRYREVYYSQSKYTIKGEDLKPDALVKLLLEGEAQLK